MKTLLILNHRNCKLAELAVATVVKRLQPSPIQPSFKQSPTKTQNISTLDYNGEFRFFNILICEVFDSIPLKKSKYVVSDAILLNIASLLKFDMCHPFNTSTREKLIRRIVKSGSIQGGYYKLNL